MEQVLCPHYMAGLKLRKLRATSCPGTAVEERAADPMSAAEKLLERAEATGRARGHRERLWRPLPLLALGRANSRPTPHPAAVVVTWPTRDTCVQRVGVGGRWTPDGGGQRDPFVSEGKP